MQVFLFAALFVACNNQITVSFPKSFQANSANPVCSVTTTHPENDLANVIFAGGDGSASNPYKICDIYQLQKIQDFPSAHFEIMQDIDASLTRAPASLNSIFETNGFLPINGFYGSLDGNAYSINDIFIESAASYVGVFGITDPGATITDITLNHPNVISTRTTGRSDVGGLIGRLNAYHSPPSSRIGKIYINDGYVKNESSSSTSFRSIGGSIGYLLSRTGDDIDLYNITSSAKVESQSDNDMTGGILGLGYSSLTYRTSQLTLRNITSQGLIEADGPDTVGGIFGYITYADIINTHSKATILQKGASASSYSGIGGVSGFAMYSNFQDVSFDGSIETQLNSATNISIGGLIGKASSVTAKRAKVGEAAIINNIVDGARIGGFIGHFQSSGSFINSFSAASIYDNSTSNAAKLGSLIGEAGFSASLSLTNTYFFNGGGDAEDCVDSAAFTGCAEETDLSGFYSAGADGHAVYDHGGADAWVFGNGRPWEALSGSSLPVGNPNLN